MDDAAPDVVTVRAGRTADKRRSWHVARVASDIQRSLADQSPVSRQPQQPRSSWHPNDDWSLPYHQGSGWATTADSGGSGDQVEQQSSKASFSIASWVDRPAPKEMDAMIANLRSTPVKRLRTGSSSSSSSSDDDDSQDEIFVAPPVVVVPVTLSTTETAEVQVVNHHKRLGSTAQSDNYIDVVVKELRGVPHPDAVSLSVT